MRSTMLEPIGTLSSFASHRLWLVISDHAVGEAPARKANSRQQKDLAMNDQREVEQFLGDGASYGTPGGAVERIDTHISMIFLVGDRAYKLKRAVRFSYLDYSTVELREKFCRAELDLNSRTAPALYLRLRAITRAPDGTLSFDGTGAVVDWVLEMRRFAQNDLFDRLAEQRKLTHRVMRDLADVIAAFHTAAETVPHSGGRAGIEQTMAGNIANLIQSSAAADAALIQELSRASMAKLATVGDLLDARRDRGRVRRCHGDLHLRNVCLFDGRPTLFDCIEFSDELSCIDVLYDLAFLLMDLVRRDLDDLANVMFNRYLDLTPDLDGLPALPLFMSVRAAVRSHVAATLNRQKQSQEARAEARSYLTLARTLLNLHPPLLIAIGGRSGAGKSTLAQALASEFKPPPGARIIRSDVLRKRMFNVAPETELPPSAYDEATTGQVYAALQDHAATTLAAGYTAIVDATFLREDERRRIDTTATRSGVPFVGFWLEAPREILAARLGARRGDASDADLSVLQLQFSLDAGAIVWQRIDASSDVARSAAAARASIEAARHGHRRSA